MRSGDRHARIMNKVKNVRFNSPSLFTEGLLYVTTKMQVETSNKERVNKEVEKREKT